MPQCGNCSQAPQTEAEGWRAPKRQVALSGILNVDKPAGLTSHDVVDRVRRMAGQRRVGHAGTLDPMATGVLLVCLGLATRVAEYLVQGRKAYRATVQFGSSTDTYDAEGSVVRSGMRTDFSAGELEAVLSSFQGTIAQVPPMYSAIKQGGRPLYEQARQGITVERAARPVQVYELSLLDWTPPALVLEVSCSPGTYVRSLAHDLGEALGSAAHLTSLVRLRSGRFALEGATSLERLEQAFRHGEEWRFLVPVDEALLDWPALIAGTEDARRIARGMPLAGDLLEAGSGVRERCRAYDLAGDFLGILAYDRAGRCWRPEKVFAQPAAENGYLALPPAGCAARVAEG